MKRWLFSLILLLMIIGVLGYLFVPRLTDRLNVGVMWNANKKQNSGLTPQEQGAAREILDLRQRHHLRPLTNAESGARTRDLAYGIYGFAACDAQTLNAVRTKDPVLEIHKHRDGIAYYVGYASEEQIEKYLTRQKNFHILASPEPRGKASLLFEIPVDFVTTCAVRAVGNGVVFDLFVTAIPELHTFHRSLERPWVTVDFMNPVRLEVRAFARHDPSEEEKQYGHEYDSAPPCASFET